MWGRELGLAVLYLPQSALDRIKEPTGWVRTATSLGSSIGIRWFSSIYWDAAGDHLLQDLDDLGFVVLMM